MDSNINHKDVESGLVPCKRVFKVRGGTRWGEMALKALMSPVVAAENQVSGAFTDPSCWLCPWGVDVWSAYDLAPNLFQLSVWCKVNQSWSCVAFSPASWNEWWPRSRLRKSSHSPLQESQGKVAVNTHPVFICCYRPLGALKPNPPLKGRFGFWLIPHNLPDAQTVEVLSCSSCALGNLFFSFASSLEGAVFILAAFKGENELQVRI